MKKFLTVLLVIAVMFTFSFGSAFAAASTSKGEAVSKLNDVAENAADSITFADSFMTGVKPAVGAGFTGDKAQYTLLSQENVLDGIEAVRLHYADAINAAASDYDDAWADVDTVTTFLNVLFDKTTSKDVYLLAMLKAQVEDTVADANLALNPNLSEYLPADKAAIEAKIGKTDGSEAGTIWKQIVDGKAADDTTVANCVQTINAYNDGVKALEDYLDTISTPADGNNDIAKAKVEAVKAINAAADALLVDVFDTNKTDWADNTDAKTLKTFKADVQTVVEYYVEAVNDLAIDVTDADFDTAAEVVAEIERITNVATTGNKVFAVVTAGDLKTTNAGLYQVLANAKAASDKNAALEKDAAEAKALLKADGTPVYRAGDVDQALAVAKDAVADEVYAKLVDSAKAGTTIAAVSLGAIELAIANGDYTLQAYKATAIDKITKGDYLLTNWEGERADKVEALQDEYKELILTAKTTDDIDALVKEAKAKMDAILTAAQIDKIEARTDVLVNAQDLRATMRDYFKVVVGTASNGYTNTIRDAAIEDAIDLIKDAVVAKENAKISDAEIKAIIAENKEAALDLLKTTKTETELKAAAAAIDEQIVAATTSEEVMAAQKALDDYLDLPGATTSYLKKYSTLKSKMIDVMSAEARAVNDMIRALPTVITANDAAAVKAAREAYDAFAEKFDDYDNDGVYSYLGTDATTLITRGRLLATAEADLEKALAKDAADKITALNADSTPAQVQAAKAAYDALSTESKLAFNEQLYNKLVAALAVVEVSSDENAKAYVQDMKIAARSVKTSKGVKVTIKADVQKLQDAGYTVEYRFYRSTKSNAKYGTPKIVKSSNVYTNTKGVKGTRYYYKAKLVVKNEKGEVVATTPLTQCLYATRAF